MEVIFYIAAIVAIFATFRVITGKNAVHSLLYLIVSLLAVAVIFFLFGAPFLAALEIIVYAGAIMVLFVFVVMMLNRGEVAVKQEKEWFSARAWIGPGILTLVLLGEFIYVFSVAPDRGGGAAAIVPPEAVGIALYGPYILGVEMTAMLLMAGVVGAYHIGRDKQKEYHRYLSKDEPEENSKEEQKAEIS